MLKNFKLDFSLPAKPNKMAIGFGFNYKGKLKS